MVLVQGPRVLLGALALASLEGSSGLWQLLCHAGFKLADECLGFNLIMYFPDVFYCQRFLVAFQDNAGARDMQGLSHSLTRLQGGLLGVTLSTCLPIFPLPVSQFWGSV